MAVAATDPTTSVGSAFSPGSMPTGLTPAQQQAFKGVQTAFSTPTSPQSMQKMSSPTVLTSANIDEKNTANVQKLQNMATSGQMVGPDGLARNADGSPADAPKDAQPTTDENGNTYYSNGAIKYATPGTVSDNPFEQKIYDQFSSLRGQMDATGAADIANIQAQYSGLIKDQQEVNSGAEAGVRSTLIRGGSQQTASSEGILQSQVSWGLRQISNLVTAENGAIIKAQQAVQDNDYKLLDKQLSIAANARAERVAAANKVNDQIVAAKKEAQTKLDETDKSIQGLIADAAKGGASPEAMKTMNDALANHDWATAMSAAAPFSQDPTSSAGQYAAYVKKAQAQGLTPATPGDWMLNQKAKEAYSTGYNSAAGKAAADAKFGNPDGAAPPTADPNATGLTAAAGISLQAFNYLTQGTASMTRMPAAQRNQIMKEANDFLNKNGLDISTFQSQYKAYNDVLQHNLERANNTKIFAGEITGTVDQFVNDIGDSFGKLKAGNVAKLFAGGQVNDPTVQKYSFDLQTMQNDLAGYYAASRTGAANATPDDSDKKAAAQVILNGINSKSASAFKQSIVDNEKKVTGVVSSAASDAQKQVWDLFGVGAQYKPKAPQINPRDAVNEYVKSNPADAEMVAKLYDVPGATDKDIQDYLRAQGKLK